MSRTFYTLHALAEGQTGIAVLYGDGHSCTTIWSCSMERARHRAPTNAFPAGQEVDAATWERAWYCRNRPTYYRIIAHPNGGYYAHLWPYGEAPFNFGRARSDERMCGAFEDTAQLKQEIERLYEGAQPVEGALQ